MKRLERKDYFMILAKLTSFRSTCSKLHVGCVLVDSNTNRIASVGYNSSHKGNVHCEEVGCLLVDDHCVRCPHAEIAAIANLQRPYLKLTAFITHEPCNDCFKALIAVGVNTIYYEKDYKDPKRDALYFELQKLNIKMEQYTPNSEIFLKNKFGKIL